MCLFLPPSALPAEQPMDAPPALNPCPDALSAAESLRDDDGGAVQTATGGNHALPAETGACVGTPSPFQQLNGDSNSLWPVALISNTHVSAEAPEEWSVPQGNFLLPSASVVVPSKIVGAGLMNLGNTCFLNAILQCFTHTVPLVEGLRACTHGSPCIGHIDGFCVICGLCALIENSLLTSEKILSPKKFVLNLNYFSSDFTRYQQEDAHEFMQCALDKLERRFLDLRSDLNFKDDNLVQKVFGGRLISKLVCCSCGHTSDTYELLIDMSLEIENVDSLPSALESFTKVENIDANFKCDSCKEEVSMEKQLMLDQTPSVAAFHLKRFKTDGTYVEKIDKHIDFPLELDLLPYTISNQNDDVLLKYDLYAVVVHTGFSSTSGHYFCFVRSAPDTWHKLDDSMVTEVSGDSVLSQEAYILFYARQGTPWFLNFMESQMQCLKQNIMNTSPKSVLDISDSMYKSNPNKLPSFERGEAGVSKECSELQSDYYCQEHNYVNNTSDATHGCGQFPIGSNHHSVALDGSKDVDTQLLSTNDATLGGSAMFDRNSHIKNGGLDNNSNCQEVVDFRKNDGFHSLTPPSSPPNDASDKFHVSHDKLKREICRSSKRPSAKVMGDPGRQFAMKYLNKTGSRREAFKEFVFGSEDLNKRRKKMDSSQCKKSNSLDDRRKSNHTSVSRSVAAGISR